MNHSDILAEAPCGAKKAAIEKEKEKSRSNKILFAVYYEPDILVVVSVIGFNLI